MKSKQLYLSLFVASVFLIACSGNQKHTEDFNALQRTLNSGADTSYLKNSTAEVSAIYFHATRRCATCEAVESVTKEALNEYYGTKVSFQSINREEDKENPMLDQYQISGQTLLIIKGDSVLNLTNEAFMNARTSPDKFKATLKSTIDSMML